MNTSNWPIRSKIIALVAVPITALVALWIFATTLTVVPASSLLAAGTLLDEMGRPGEQVVAELQQERRLSVVYLADPRTRSALVEQRASTDRAAAEFRRRASGAKLRDAAGPLLLARLDQAFTALETLPAGRGFVDDRKMDRIGAVGLYSSVIDAMFRSFTAMIELPDEALARQARALTALGQARELLARADALLAGVLAAGRFAEGEHEQLVQIIGTRRFLYASTVAELPDSDRTSYQRLTETADFVRLREMEEALVSKGRTGAAPPVNASSWSSEHESVQRQLRDFELAAADRLAEESRPVAVGVLVRLGLAGVLGLLAVLVSVLVAVRIGRSLVGRMTGLRAAALDLAGERLPGVVGRLRRGEEVDVDREVPALDYGSDEVGQVGQAFSEVQRTAVQSAVDEAALRRGLNEVFLNIARRSQTLLHRQLALLDRMERRTTEPDELADLFRIDHMATRMRRHAEDLVILAGAAPGRGWRNPVDLIDVVRGAISEVEDYGRVTITVVEPAALMGRAVGDLIHLLAELIENATAFSPPHTRVHVAGQVVPNGYAVEVEDRGLGMSPEAIEAANQRLAEPPDFDPTNSARLGLFVVAQLGARHGVQVRLRASPYGGITAVALVPAELIVARPDVPALAGRPVGGSDPAPAGAPAPRPADGSDPSPAGSVALRPGRTRDEPRRTSAGFGGRSASGGRRTGRGLPRSAEVPVGPDGLPRRIRQDSLAPQLRNRPTDAAVSGEVVDGPATRTPEEIRSRMSALQAGTARGRRDSEPVTVAPLAGSAGPEDPLPVAAETPADERPAETSTGEWPDGTDSDQERDPR